MKPDQDDIDLAILKAHFQNKLEDRYVREHSYYGYWMRVITDTDHLTRDLLDEILTHKDWTGALGDIVLLMCKRNMLSPIQTELLLTELPDSSFAYDQVFAYTAIHNPDLSWTQRLTTALDRRADWAAMRIIRDTPQTEFHKAREIILNSRRPRSTKEPLLSLLGRLESQMENQSS
jgi:hypothetical protein